MEKFLKNRFTQHILFWLFFIIVLRGSIFHEFELEKTPLARHLYGISFLIYISLVYLNLYFFLPKLFLQKKYLFYFASVFFLALFLIGSAYHIMEHINPSLRTLLKLRHWVLYSLFVCFALIVLSTFLHFIKRWSVMNEINLKAQREKVSAELDALKAQINPHLLFNSLNNIYSLSLQKSDKVPGLLLKLSELMSYILYECKADFVPLNNEIEFITNYISLEKIRLEESAEIQMNCETTDPSLEIAPLLLLPFIDNAFKHSKTIASKRRISIQIKTNKNILSVFIENNFEPIRDHHKVNGGIGIMNAKKRLEYIYPKNHKLDIYANDKIFSIKLDITLNQINDE